MYGDYTRFERSYKMMGFIEAYTVFVIFCLSVKRFKTTGSLI